MPDPDDSGPASVRPSDASAPQSGTRVDDEDAPPSSGPVSARDADEEAPPSSGTFKRVHTAIYLFISSRKEKEGRDFVIRVVKASLGSDVAHAMLEDIVQGALAKAAECRWPPWTEGGVPAWLARLTRRHIADYFRKEQGREEKPKPGKDERARARLLHDWLAKRIGDDPRKVATLGLMKEHEVDGFTLAELAARERTTERALANRFHKLRKELGPKVRRMDDEQTRRSVFLALILLGLGVFVALVLWLLGVFTPPPPAVPPHEATPSATVVAPPPVFNQALPPPSSSEVPVGPKP